MRRRPIRRRLTSERCSLRPYCVTLNGEGGRNEISGSMGVLGYTRIDRDGGRIQSENYERPRMGDFESLEEDECVSKSVHLCTLHCPYLF